MIVQGLDLPLKLGQLRLVGSVELSHVPRRILPRKVHITMAQSELPLGDVLLLFSDFHVAPIILEVMLHRSCVRFSWYLGVPEDRLLDLLSE